MAGRPRRRAAAKDGGIAFTSKVAESICDLIAEGHSLQTVSEMPGFPTRRSMRRWLTEHSDFEHAYEIARRQRTDNLVDEAIAIADAVDGGNAAEVQKARLQIDTRRWLASKLLPERFGDKLAVEATGKDGAALYQPEPNIAKTALSIMALLASMPGGKNDPRTIDAVVPQLASLPAPDPESEARRLQALRTGSPLPLPPSTTLSPFDPQPEQPVDLAAERELQRLRAVQFPGYRSPPR
jgi:hypothetical protein